MSVQTPFAYCEVSFMGRKIGHRWRPHATVATRWKRMGRTMWNLAHRSKPTLGSRSRVFRVLAARVLGERGMPLSIGCTPAQKRHIAHDLCLQKFNGAEHACFASCHGSVKKRAAQEYMRRAETHAFEDMRAASETAVAHQGKCASFGLHGTQYFHRRHRAVQLPAAVIR